MGGRPPLPSGPYLIVGLARSGIGAARALRRRGLPALGLDSGSAEPKRGLDSASPESTPRLDGASPERSRGLDEAAQALRQEGVEVHLGVSGVGLLTRVGSVIKSPGVPDEAEVIVAARRQGLAVLGELELAWRLLPNELIAVTGTNGKTTTVELIAHVHREAGLPVALAGNVGLALSALVDRVGDDVPIVCEASSFQLQDSVELAPDVAVLLNITPDHLDRHGSFEAYAEAKLQAFARQREEAIAVLPSGLTLGDVPIEERLREVGCEARIVRFAGEPGSAADVTVLDGHIAWRGTPLLAVSELRIKGAHNVENAMAAAAVCLARGIDPEALAAGLASFPGVAHRLEEVRRLQGVAYINDSKATNVASTLVALAALRGERGRRVHLMLGGQRKGQDLSSLREPVRESCAAVYTIGQDAPLIEQALADAGVPLHSCDALERAVPLAAEHARRARATAGWVAAARRPATRPHADEALQVVLLSPACASFDQFAGFEARGERFRELVAAL